MPMHQLRAVSRLAWKSTSRPSFSNFRFSCIINNRAAKQQSPEYRFYWSTMTTTRSSVDTVLTRGLSTLSEKKQVSLDNRDTDVPEVKTSQRLQGGGEKPEPDKNQSKASQLKKVFKEYGAVGVSFHIGISLISLGIFYVAVSSGIDMTAVLCKLGFSESVVQSKMAAGTSTFVLAYAIHKLFAPLRISITLVSVPFIVRHLRKTGLFKPAPPKSG